MQVKSEELVDLLVGCGYAKAAEWGEEQIRKRLEKLEAVVDKAPTELSGKQERFAESIIQAQKAGEDIQIEFATPAEKPKKKGGRNATPAATDPDGDDKNPDDAGDDETEKKPKKKPGKKVGNSPVKTAAPKEKAKPGAKGVGVLACIEATLRKASAKRPATRDMVLDKLCEKFPDRERDSMKVTVVSQLPKRLIDIKGLKVKNNGKPGKERGYWIED